MQKILKRFFVLVCVLLMFILSAHATTLPNGYTQLEYIESSGTQCINTGYKWTTDITEVGIEYWLSNTNTSDIALYGSEATWSSAPWVSYGGVLYGVKTSLSYMVGTAQWLATYTPKLEDWETYIAKTTSSTQGSIIRNDTEVSFTYANGVSKVYSMGLFCSHKRGSYQQFSKARIRKFYMKDNNVIVRDLIPAKRNSDDEVGMYDIIKNKFYTNAGSGTFIAGPVVNTCTYTTMLGTQVCLSESQPTGSYLVVRQNGNKYYLNLSVENDALNPKTITSESNNVLRIKVGNTTYNAHDTSVN